MTKLFPSAGVLRVKILFHVLYYWAEKSACRKNMICFFLYLSFCALQIYNI